MTLMPYWAQRFQSGAASSAELDHAANTQWNVIDEITMIVRKT